MATKVRELKNLVIDEISLVDKGANQHAMVTIAKRDGSEEEKMEDELYDSEGHPVDVDELEFGDVVFDGDGQAYEVEPDDDYDVTKNSEGRKATGTERVLAQFAGAPMTNAVMGKDGRRIKAAWSGAKEELKGAGVGGAAGALLGGAVGRGDGAAVGGVLGSQIGSRVGSDRGVRRAAREGHLYDPVVQKSYGDNLREEFSKALSDNDRDEVISKAIDYIDEVSKSAEAAYLVAEMERDARLEAEYVEIAKGYNVGIDPEVLGPVFKRMSEVMDEDDVAVIASALDSASMVIEKNFEELGAAGLHSNSDVLNDVDYLVESMVSKSQGNFTREEAVTGIFEENPQAYDEYLAERQGR